MYRATKIGFLERESENFFRERERERLLFLSSLLGKADPKDAYPPPGYPQQGYPQQGYPPQGYPPQYAPQYGAPPPQQQQSGSTGFMEGWYGP